MRRALCCFAVTVLLAGCGSDDSGGPLVDPAGSAWTTYGVVGEPFLHGQSEIYDDGKTPVPLEGVELINPTPGLRVISTRVSGYRRGDSTPTAGPVKFYTGADAPTDLHPLKGYEVLPRTTRLGKRGVRVVIYMKVDRPGRYKYDGFQIVYRTRGGALKRDRIRNAFAICVGNDYDTVSKGNTCARAGIPER